MTNGIVATLEELISLRRYAQKMNYKMSKNSLQLGGYQSTFRGRGMDFMEARHYQAGDDIRHMEWRMTARRGRPHVKVYQEERERPVVLLCDFNPSMYFGTRGAFKSVIAARLAAMIAWVVMKQGDRIGALIYSANRHKEFSPHSRYSGVLPCLSALSAYTHYYTNTTANPLPFSDSLLRLKRISRPGSTLILISDFYLLDKESEPHLSRLCAHNNILAYHICDTLELGAPKPNYYPITNGQREMIFDTTKKIIFEGYQHYCEERVDHLKSYFKRLQIPYAQVTAETHIPRLVQLTLPRRSSD